MRLPRLLIPAAVLLVLLVLAFVALRSSAPPPSSGHPAPLGAQPPGRKPLIFDLGALGQDPEGRRSALAGVAALGADAVRVVIPWAAIAPAKEPQGFHPADPRDRNYDFADLDAYLREIHSHGLRILLSASSPFPRWASASGSSDISDPDPARFGVFMRALAQRYAGGFDPDGSGGKAQPLPGVSMWSVWNEPNLAIFLQPVYRDGHPYAPQLYRRLFEAASSSIRAEDPGTPILTGETAPTGGDAGIDPVPFARSVLCLDAKLRRIKGCRPIEAAGWATHPYATGTNPPFDSGSNPDFVTLDLMGNLEHVLAGAAAARTTSRQLPIYIDEYGVQSKPDPNVGVTLEHQADYLAIAERMAYAEPAVASFAQYLLRDDSPEQVPGQLYGGFESGLLTFDNSVKPALNAFRTPLAVQRVGDRVSLWAMAQPARSQTTLTIKYQDPGGALKELGRFRTDGAGILTRSAPYEPGRRWQVQWTAKGQTFHGPLTPAYAFGLPTS